MSGHRYYIIFIDAFSRVSWIYLLKNRGHIYDVLKSFITEIKNQFDVISKCLRTDNVLEFVQFRVESYCVSLGVIHQTICFHTSQQNKIAERKYRHILDVTYIIMTHVEVSKHLWSDAVLTATLGGEVLLQHLRPLDTNLFTLTFRVFRCLVFIQDLSLGLDKLSPKSIKCIFVGYCRTQRGYRCFHPSTRRYFVSADVTFF